MDLNLTKKATHIMEQARPYNDRMADTLTAGAISKILTSERQEFIDLKPVVQVLDIIKCIRTQSHPVFSDEVAGEEWYAIVLSDGKFFHVHVMVDDKINELVRSKQLVKGSVVQLTKFYTWKPRNKTIIIIADLNVICLESKIIGNPTAFILPGMENNAPIVTYQDGDIDLGHIEVVDVSHHPRKLSFNDCFEKLEKLEWGTHDPFYETAIMLFDESAACRKIWLQLKPESCRKWVENAGRKFGLLDPKKKV